MRKGNIKRHRRRAHLKEMFFDLAVDAWNIFLGLVPVWGPMLMAALTGMAIWLLGW
jgi:hypothetical protein|nr:MAG TPA: protein of unknown function (DUF4112) [Caudoviricetes sp.]